MDSLRRPRPRELSLLIGLAWLAAGCAEGAAPNVEVQRTTVGDTSVITTVAGQAWEGAVVLREEVVIGVVDGPPELMFGEVTRLAADPDGGVYVLDRQAVQIRHYDRDGVHLRDIGRSGEGPGEYQYLSLGMVVDPAGVLYMHDWGNGRIVRLDSEGTSLDSWPMGSPFLTTSRGRWVFAEGPGRVLVAARVHDSPALVAIEEGLVSDTIFVPRLPGVPAQRGGPYSIDTYWTLSPDGCVVVGVSDAYSFDVRCADGVLRIQRAVEALPVHPDEASEIRARFEWMEREPAYSPPQGEWVPAEMPAFSALDAGTDGRIWVRRNAEPIRVEVEPSSSGQPPSSWAQPFLYDVFETDGTFLGQVRFPDDFEPHLFGSGHVWGVREGDFGEHYVVRLAIEVPK